ncbi:MAG: UvrD-helicase domain-containing protein [Spirochaetaceae bacterium]|nr:UvrD-helicase domain-containing protein [Spirochaetaceae bacterium]
MSSIGRLVNLAGSDPGFYILALHSYMENYLKNDSPVLFTDYEYGDFGRNIMKLGEHISKQHENYNPDLKCFKAIAGEHRITNEVRHEFKDFTSAEATQATFLFLQFCRLVQIDEGSALAQLESTLEHWNDRRSRKVEVEELKRLKWDVFRSQRENKKLHEKLEQWQAEKKEYDEMHLELNVLNSQLALYEKKDNSHSSNNKKLIDKRLELKEKLKEKEILLEQYKSIASYSYNLKRMVAYTRTRLDYERSIVRLTMEQKEILARIDLEGDYLIRGAAGTGKTYLILEVMRKAIIDRKESLWDEGSFVLLSYTKTLVKYNRYITHIMKLDAGNNDYIGTVDSYMYGLLRKIDKGNIDFKILVDLCKKYNDESVFSSYKQLICELEEFIYWNGINKEEYIDDSIERRGMNIPLNRAKREIVWDIKTAVEKEMLSLKKLSKGFSRYLIGQEVSKTDVDTFFVDESQDLSPLELQILKKSAQKGLIMAGDLGQSIYGIQSPYKRSGINVQGHTSVLKTNFRSTHSIHDLAKRFRNKDENEESSAFRDGPHPELFTASETEELYLLLNQRIHFLIDVLEYDPDNIFILVANSTMEKKVSRMVFESGYDTVNVKDDSFDFLKSKEIRISPFHSSKGLDMPVVLLFLPKLFTVNSESYNHDTTDQMRRNLLYVCMTRAMDMLNVFMKEEPEDEILNDLKRAFDELKEQE